MTEQGEQGIYVKFCFKLEHFSVETILMTHLGVTGDWQLHHDNAPAHAPCLLQRFLEKHQITQVTQPLYSPDFGKALKLLAFPKTKITF